MDDLEYYAFHLPASRWKKRNNACLVQDVSVSFERPPPRIEAPPPVVKPSPKIQRPTVAEQWGNLFTAIDSAANWLTAPEPPKSPGPSLIARIKAWADEPDPPKQVPPFDIQEIPGAMRKNGLHMSAMLMERWFAGRLNYSPTTRLEALETNQEGRPYPADMYDTTTVTMDWVLQFPRGKEKYEHLLQEAIRSQAAIQELQRRFASYAITDENFKTSAIDTSEIARDNPTELHRKYQFQRVSVDGTI